MLADDVEANFPKGVYLPPPIRELCNFLDANDYPISGCFEISTMGDDDMAAWFSNDLAMQNQFAVFRLKQHLNMDFSVTGFAIVSRAKEKYSGFGEFVRHWQDANL